MNSAQGRQRDPLLAFREEFPILGKTTYLVSNSLGPMPRTVPEKLAEYARDWGELGVKAWNRGWWELPVSVGNEIAPLINAGEGEIVMMPNVTIAQTAVLSSIDFTKTRDTVVMTELDFPSVRYAYSELAQRLGARVVVVRSDDGLTIDRDRLLAAIDDRTRLVAVSHVLFRSAYLMDVDAICARAHEVGALVSLDSFHAVGIVPVDVKRSKPDFLTGGVLKWLSAEAGAHGMAGTLATIRVRGRDGIHLRRLPLAEWNAGDSRSLRRRRRAKDSAPGRRRRHQGEERSIHFTVDRARRQLRPCRECSARPRPPRRHRGDRCSARL